MELYLDNVYRWFGVPTKIISDRDPHFMSHFAKALCQKLGIQQNLSSAFHPQTDGITERKNQWVEQYLHLVTSSSPKDWTRWLTITSAVHNNQKNSTTRLFPNQVLLGYETKMNPSEDTPSNNEMAQSRIKTLMEQQTQAIDAINQSVKQGQKINSQF